MALPDRCSQSCGGHPAVAPSKYRPAVIPSSETMAPSGKSAPTTPAAAAGVRAPVGISGRPAATSWATSADAAATASTERLECAGDVLGPAREDVHPQPGGSSSLGRFG